MKEAMDAMPLHPNALPFAVRLAGRVSVIAKSVFLRFPAEGF